MIASHPRLLVVLLLVAVMVLAVAVCDIAVIINARGRISSSPDELSSVPPVALLLGTSPLTTRHTRNHSFYNRIDAAARLYKSGKISKIIASGGDYSKWGGRDEPQCMTDCLVAAGVPRDSIIADYDGQRTILSIINARKKYGLDSVVIISQQYHCERALMQADHYGLKAVGFSAENTTDIGSLIRNWGRERLARVKLMIDLIND